MNNFYGGMRVNFFFSNLLKQLFDKVETLLNSPSSLLLFLTLALVFGKFQKVKNDALKWEKDEDYAPTTFQIFTWKFLWFLGTSK